MQSLSSVRFSCAGLDTETNNIVHIRVPVMHVFCLEQSNVHTGGASYQSLRQGKLSLVANVPTPLFNMMRSMMTPNPADRPSPDKILSSALFAKKAQKENKSHHAFGGLNLQPSRVK